MSEKPSPAYWPVAFQPDGKFHLALPHDPGRSLCGLRLTDYEQVFALLANYGTDVEDCRACLRELVSKTGWSLEKHVP
jgi:hypothetical protein